MKSIPRTILAILLTVATFCVAAAQQTNVFYPAFPVLAGRSHNIVSEICIDGKRGSTLDYVEVALDGIDRKAVRNVKLMYTGTTSVIPSRTTSFVISDWVRMYGGGQKLWCHPDFAIEISTTRIKDGKAYLPCGKALVDGPNYMYVSMEIAEEKVDLSMPFKADVQAISVDGKQVDIEKDGNAVRHLGTSVRQAGDDGSDSYRIPGLVTTKKGTLIAVYDVRYDSSQDLQCNIDIGVSRSIDAGRTWEKMRVVMDLGEWGGLPQAQNGIGDPAVLVDEETGEIFVIAVWTHGIGGRRAWTGVRQGIMPEETAQLMICSSKDDGKTWSEPVNITSQIKQPEWYLTLQGPGRGITMHDGTLVFPIQYIGTDRIPNAGIIYSKDHGKTWHMHNHAYTNTTEAQVAEVSPGVLMLNMRDNRRTGRRVCTTTDLGKTWTEHPSSGHLVEPVCMASLISVPADDNVFGRDILLFSNPATTKGRHHMTIKASLDGGNTWLEANSLLLDEEELWGYSCMSMIDNETVGILYEGSTSQLVFQAIKLKEIIKEMNDTINAETLGKPTEASEGYLKGISAPFCGSLYGQVITAGGANFPEKPVVEGGLKKFYKDIFSISQNGEWNAIGELPTALAYGCTFSLEDRVIFAGGSNLEGTVDSVYSISINNGKASVENLDALPVKIDQAGFTNIGNSLYIAGGVANGVPSSSVFNGTFDGKNVIWKEISRLPEPMVQPVIFVNGKSLYVWGGCNPATGDVISKGYMLDMENGEWKDVASVPENGTFTGSAISVVNNRAYVTGGVNKEVFSKGIRAIGDEKKAYMTMPPAKYRFNRHIWEFDPSAESWKSLGECGKTALAGAGMIAIGNKLYIIGGEIKPGVRTPESWIINIK